VKFIVSVHHSVNAQTLKIGIPQTMHAHVQPVRHGILMPMVVMDSVKVLLLVQALEKNGTL